MEDLMVFGCHTIHMNKFVSAKIVYTTCGGYVLKVKTSEGCFGKTYSERFRLNRQAEKALLGIINTVRVRKNCKNDKRTTKNDIW